MAQQASNRGSPKTHVDAKLVKLLKRRIADASTDGTTVERESAVDQFGSGREVEGERVADDRLSSEVNAQRRLGPFPGKSRRTTLSVPNAVAKKARQLTMAITAAEQQDASLGDTLSLALDLLEAELKDKGIPIASHPVRLRSGPRGA